MPLSDKAAAWLEARGFVDPEFIVRLQLASGFRKRGDTEREEAVRVPYFRGGEIHGHKYRFLRDDDELGNWTQDPGGVKILYNRDAITDPGLLELPLVITEGEWDAMACMASGHWRVVSVPNGAPKDANTKRHDYLREALRDLKACNDVVIAVDADDQGLNLRQDIVARLGRVRCRIAEYPKGCKDLNDVLKQHGKSEVLKCIMNAKRFAIGGIYKYTDMPEEPPLDPKRVRALGADFCKHVGICLGQTSIWTGYHNRGKTALIRNVCIGLAQEHGWRIGGAFFEDIVRQTFGPAIIRSICNMAAPGPEDIAYGEAWLDENFRFLTAEESDDEPDPKDGEGYGELTIPWLVERIEALAVWEGCKFIVIDPWTELDLEKERGDFETDLVKAHMKTFRRLARKRNIHIAILAHPRKPAVTANGALPTGDDIAGSAHFGNFTHLGVSVQSDTALGNISEVLVWKSKHAETMGPKGRFFLEFDKESLRFNSIPEQDVLDMRARLNGAEFEPRPAKRRARAPTGFRHYAD